MCQGIALFWVSSIGHGQRAGVRCEGNSGFWFVFRIPLYRTSCVLWHCEMKGNTGLFPKYDSLSRKIGDLYYCSWALSMLLPFTWMVAEPGNHIQPQKIWSSGKSEHVQGIPVWYVLYFGVHRFVGDVEYWCCLCLLSGGME